MRRCSGSEVEIYDPTLRDGNHAVRHSLTLWDIENYCRAIDGCGVDVVEVGHGNGLGASSLQLGLSPHSDETMLACARKFLTRTKLGVHIIPGFARLDDVRMAADHGVDVVRVASHCTEADLTRRYIECARGLGKTAQGVLMMTHMASPEKLLEQASRQQSYGANSIVLMDSAGAYLESDVVRKVGLLADELDVPVGFHAHNNLGLSVSNTVAAVASGAAQVDGTVNGFGAGAGNTPLEVLVAVMWRMGYSTHVDFFRLLESSTILKSLLEAHRPSIKPANLLSGIFGVFSGFEKPVARAAEKYGVEPKDIYQELGRRNVVAGQEDLIVEIALEFAKKLRAVSYTGDHLK